VAILSTVNYWPSNCCIILLCAVMTQARQYSRQPFKIWYSAGLPIIIRFHKIWWENKRNCSIYPKQMECQFTIIRLYIKGKWYASNFAIIILFRCLTLKVAYCMSDQNHIQYNYWIWTQTIACKSTIKTISYVQFVLIHFDTNLLSVLLCIMYQL
jgi:hypothetical protein